jgi:hypothetical protein
MTSEAKLLIADGYVTVAKESHGESSSSHPNNIKFVQLGVPAKKQKRFLRGEFSDRNRIGFDLVYRLECT